MATVALLCATALITPAHSAASGPPQIAAAWVEQVTNSGVKMKMELNPNGLSTEYFFEYITEAAYQANSPAERFAGAVKTTVAMTTATTFLTASPTLNTPLIPGTVYHYRPVASNADGVAANEGLEHVFVTKESGSPVVLPDNRAWEMVSPVDKGGGAIAAPEELFGGGDLQASAAGGSVTYGSGTAFGEAAGAAPVSQYVSRREPAGWVTENVSPPLESAAYGDHPDGAPYRLFSADLSRALLFGGLACRGGLEGCPAPNQPLPGSGAPAGYMAYYLRQAGQLSSLLGPADVAHSAVSPPAFEVALAAAAPDLAHVVVLSCAQLTAEASELPDGPGRCDPAAQNLYETSPGGLRAINLLPGDSTGTPGASIAAPIGAVSDDGSRVYWTLGGNLYLREGSQTVAVDESVGGGGTFQLASTDGAVALFTKAGHLYRFTLGEGVVDLTPGGGVLGVLGASSSAAYVYFQDAAGLELWHGGAIAAVAEAGPETALASDYPPAAATARVSPDGLRLVFLSKQALTEFDNVDANSKQPDAELYVFDAIASGSEPSLVCASCNPSGERPDGPASIPGVLVNGSTRAYRPEALSNDGSRLFFESGDAISDKDTNGKTDVYEWEANGTAGCAREFGCVAPISSVTGAGATFVDASADATDVFFLTPSSLVSADPGSVDLYDARVNGGGPAPVEPIVCVGDNCQPLPSEPEDPTPGTLVPNPGNPPLRIFGPRKKKKHKLRRHRHHRKHRHAGRRGR